MFFFFQKAENSRLKKEASQPNFPNIIFLFLLKIGSVGLVDQQTRPLTMNYLHSKKVCI